MTRRAVLSVPVLCLSTTMEQFQEVELLALAGKRYTLPCVNQQVSALTRPGAQSGGLAPGPRAELASCHVLKGLAMYPYKTDLARFYIESAGEYLAGSPRSILEDLTLRAAKLTHNDHARNGACVAFSGICFDLICNAGSPGDAIWWLERWIELSRPMEGERPYKPRGGAFRRWHAPVPSVVYILARHGDDPEEAIVRAVNHTKDNETIAAIVGAALGAAYGLSSLPRRWVSGLTGQINGHDSGSVQTLVERAVQVVSGG